MKATNSLVKKAGGSESPTFSGFINSPAIRAMIEKSVNDPKKAASLVSTLISAVSTNEKLRQCDGNTVVAAALRGEVGMGLSLALGQYAIVPYGNQAAFQLMDKGLRQMAIRSGQYADIDCFDVREGEYIGRDPRTRKAVFQWIEDEDEREEKPIVGYYAYYQLNGENNDFFKAVYWSHEKILKHADRYAPAFSLEKYRQLLSGELSEDETKKLRSGSPWYDLPDSVPHQKMCMKTVMKQLLSDGFAPLEVQRAISADDLEERSGNPMIFPQETASPAEAFFQSSGAKENPPSEESAGEEGPEEEPQKPGDGKKTKEPAEPNAPKDRKKSATAAEVQSSFFDRTGD